MTLSGYLFCKFIDSSIPLQLLRTVAAFANTFGGLLIIGVSEAGGRADQLVGVPSQRKEIKTAIASAIASSISPTPSYEIRDVTFPDGSGKHLCLVRVRKGSHLHLLTKKGEQPVYVRNEDQSIPADAAKLQALLTTRASTVSTEQSVFNDPPGFYVSQINPAAVPAQRGRSETYLQVQVIPGEPQVARLDLSVEQKLQSILRGTYPGLAAAIFSEVRNRYWYQVTYLDELPDYEMRWAITDNGVLHFITQVRCTVQTGEKFSPAWSLSDLMTNLDCTIEVAHRLWNYLEYLGEGRIFANLHVEGLPLLERTDGLRAFYAYGRYDGNAQRKRARALPTSALARAAAPGGHGTAMTDLTYATMAGSHADPVALLTNQILRDLGHSTNLSDLRLLL